MDVSLLAIYKIKEDGSSHFVPVKCGWFLQKE